MHCVAGSPSYFSSIQVQLATEKYGRTCVQRNVSGREAKKRKCDPGNKEMGLVRMKEELAANDIFDGGDSVVVRNDTKVAFGVDTKEDNSESVKVNGWCLGKNDKED